MAALSAPLNRDNSLENPENLKLKHAILMTFDPFTNAELRKEAENEYGWNLDNGAELEAYYQRPAQCVLRIWDSAKKWIADDIGFLPKSEIRKILETPYSVPETGSVWKGSDVSPESL